MNDATVQHPKRLLFYVHYDRDGMVDPHVFYQIKALHNFGIYIIFISNSPVSDEDKFLLYPFIEDIYIRKNKGYDWTAWKEAIINLYNDIIYSYDELILMNDSCYGPIFPLEEMFSKMDHEKVDFWGITENTDPNHVDHIQSYFCVFRKSIFMSNDFMNFLRSMRNIITFKDAIYNGELYMTQYFIKKGYRYSVYINMENMKLIPQIGIEHALIYSIAPWIIRNYRIPFVKIKAFRTAWDKPFTMGQELFIALKDRGSAYPTRLILDHLRRTRPLSWHKNLPGTLMALDEDAPVHPDPGLKIAVFAHLFYVDQVDESLDWLSHIPYPFDLYVSTSSEDKAVAIRHMAESHAELRIQKLEIRVMENCGQDVALWLLGFNDVQDQYDLALKFHLKKEPKPNPVFLWELNNFILKSTLASPGYISNIINMFKADEKIGAIFHIFPPMLIFDRDKLLENIDYKKKLLHRLGINPPEETSWGIYCNNIFWYRPKSLHTLLNSDTKEFQKEPVSDKVEIMHEMEKIIPYIIQGSRYYYKLVIPRHILHLVFQHYEDLISSELPKRKKERIYKYCRCDPGNIPLGRLLQIMILSIYQHITKKLR